MKLISYDSNGKKTERKQDVSSSLVGLSIDEISFNCLDFIKLREHTKDDPQALYNYFFNGLLLKFSKKSNKRAVEI